MNAKQIIGKKVLISPLNWGMGHVSRCIGLIDILRKQKNEIVIACEENQRAIFREYYDDVSYVSHAGYPFSFSGKGRFAWDLGKQILPLKKRLFREKREVEEFVRLHNIDVVISDHRYGFFSEKCLSIFVTHQLNLPLKWHQYPIKKVHDAYLKQYDVIWVLDTKDNRLSGMLSKNKGWNNVEYVGAVSRFSRYKEAFEKTIPLVVVASGPDVYAQQLVDFALEKYQDRITVLCRPQIVCPQHVMKITGSWLIQDDYLLRAQKIVSRSGYSTIMDLQFLDVDVDFIATPGQAEQEYLQSLHT